MEKAVEKLSCKKTIVNNNTADNKVIPLFFKTSNVNSLDESYNELNLSREESAATMDENSIIDKYLNKIDQDRRDQEERISKNIELMEKRITEERRLSEDRMEKRFNETMNKLDKLDGKIDKMEDKLDNTHKWIIALCISTILGIAAMAISVIISIKK